MKLVTCLDAKTEFVDFMLIPSPGLFVALLGIEAVCRSEWDISADSLVVSLISVTEPSSVSGGGGAIALGTLLPKLLPTQTPSTHCRNAQLELVLQICILRRILSYSCLIWTTADKVWANILGVRDLSSHTINYATVCVT